MDVYDEINIMKDIYDELNQPQINLEFDIPYEHVTFPTKKNDEINPNTNYEFDIPTEHTTEEYDEINPNINWGFDITYDLVSSSTEEYNEIDSIFNPTYTELLPCMPEPITNKKKCKQNKKKLYEYSINKCTKRLYSKAGLQEHVNSHFDSKPYKCPECDKGFNNNANFTRHLRIHTGRQPFSCCNCGRKFNQSNNKYSHEKICIN